ncbi:hypothetical protein ACRYCC_20645 [Actinomadura scrupuli]|uniref:hypothetical protein n=1 Tax=Actinomadura scrupuli TaxID=559629 RepID=UPI003D96BDC7
MQLARPWQRDLGPFPWDQITKIGPVPLTAPGADRPRLYLAIWGQGLTQDPARARPLFPLGLRGLPWDEIQAVVSRYRPNIQIGH